MKIEPADSGVIEQVTAELKIPDPIKFKAMEIINGDNTRTDGDNPCCRKQNCPKS